MICCEQCFYHHPPGTLFCDNCGAALSPWELEREDIAYDASVSDRIDYTMAEPVDFPMPFYSPNGVWNGPNSGQLRTSSGELAGVGAQADDAWAARQGAADGQPHLRQGAHRARPDHIDVGAYTAPKCVWIMLNDGQTFELTGKSQYLIGRRDPRNNVSPDVDLTNWNGAADGVSRVHATLYVTSIGVFIEDLESRNETFRNSDRLLPRQRYTLQDGDVLRLGLMTLNVQFAQESAPPGNPESW